MAYYQHPRLSVSEKWLAEKIIHPSTSEYALPAVLVSNKNGRKRLLYQNYRKLNESLIRDNNPMAHMENVLDKLQGYKRLTLFTKFIMAVLRELIKNFVVSGRH